MINGRKPLLLRLPQYPLDLLSYNLAMFLKYDHKHC